MLSNLFTVLFISRNLPHNTTNKIRSHDRIGAMLKIVYCVYSHLLTFKIHFSYCKSVNESDYYVFTSVKVIINIFTQFPSFQFTQFAYDLRLTNTFIFFGFFSFFHHVILKTSIFMLNYPLTSIFLNRLWLFVNGDFFIRIWFYLLLMCISDQQLTVR